jgi:ribosome-binding protein aMBF1 (putative translation factor)
MCQSLDQSAPDQHALDRSAANVEHLWMPRFDQEAAQASSAFGSRLRDLRAQRGVSQDDLSRESDIHSTAIGRLERGAREPRLTTILRLAHGLGVEPGELINDLEGNRQR